MQEKAVTISCAPGLCTMLAVLFIGLKLTNYISWSWWLVLLPLYGPLALAAVICLCFLLFLGVGVVISAILGN